VAVATVLVGIVLDMIGVASAFGAGRFRGMLGNPNTLGYFVAPIFPALMLMAASPGQERDRSLILATIAVLAVALVLSGSRGGVLSAISGVTAGMAAAQPRRRGLAAVLLVGTVLGALVLARDRPMRPETPERFLEVGTGSGRIPAWQHGLRLVADRPLLGYGFATTPTFFREAAPRPAEQPGRLHNSYLEAAVDLGWPGAFFLLILALSGAWSAWGVARGRGSARSVGAVLFAGIIGGMTEGVSETGLLSAGGLLAFHFWLLVGAAHALRVRAGREVTT
jgi:O-antigen ligase